jgi:hypothetical protein
MDHIYREMGYSRVLSHFGKNRFFPELQTASLTKSFMEGMKSQTTQQNKTIADLITNQLKRDEAYRT